MNCRELQSYFEGQMIEELGDNLAVSEHIARCADCRDFAETRTDLAARLHLLRDVAPPVSMSLDSSVLANYRRQMATRHMAEVTRPQFAAWKLAAATAAALLVLAVAVATHNRPVTKALLPAPITDVAHAPQAASPRASDHKTVRRNNVAAGKNNLRKPSLAARNAAAASSEMPQDLVAEGFRSLMYCDELTCDGGMEVLRVQLPAPIAGFMPSSTSANHVVNAEVLVGADGFARGIRIVH